LGRCPVRWDEPSNRDSDKPSNPTINNAISQKKYQINYGLKVPIQPENNILVKAYHQNGKQQDDTGTQCEPWLQM